MEKFTIEKNTYLTSRAVVGYFHQYYTGYRNEGNPDFVNELKNTYENKSITSLINYRNEVVKCLLLDIPKIINDNNYKNCVCMCVPRAKALVNYSNTQLYFKEAIKVAINNITGVIDGTEFITRVTNTRTTHLRNVEGNDGALPYKGITIETCKIDRSKVMGKNIILIDDIYTRTVNIDEDCIQALFDNGAKNVIFYSIGYTRRV